MGTTKGPSEGGSGGKRGHSNQKHWGYTEEVKEEARRIRRIEDGKESKSGIKEYKDEGKK